MCTNLSELLFRNFISFRAFPVIPRKQNIKTKFPDCQHLIIRGFNINQLCIIYTFKGLNNSKPFFCTIDRVFLLNYSYIIIITYSDNQIVALFFASLQ